MSRIDPTAVLVVASDFEEWLSSAQNALGEKCVELPAKMVREYLDRICAEARTSASAIATTVPRIDTNLIGVVESELADLELTLAHNYAFNRFVGDSFRGQIKIIREALRRLRSEIDAAQPPRRAERYAP